MIDYFTHTPFQTIYIDFEEAPEEVLLIFRGYKYRFYTNYFKMNEDRLFIPFSLSKTDADIWAKHLERKYDEIRVLEQEGLYCVLGIK